MVLRIARQAIKHWDSVVIDDVTWTESKKIFSNLFAFSEKDRRNVFLEMRKAFLENPMKAFFYFTKLWVMEYFFQKFSWNTEYKLWFSNYYHAYKKLKNIDKEKRNDPLVVLYALFDSLPINLRNYDNILEWYIDKKRTVWILKSMCVIEESWWVNNLINSDAEEFEKLFYNKRSLNDASMKLIDLLIAINSGNQVLKNLPDKLNPGFKKWDITWENKNLWFNTSLDAIKSKWLSLDKERSEIRNLNHELKSRVNKEYGKRLSSYLLWVLNII